MVAKQEQDSTLDTHPLDALVNDPTGLPPMCDEEDFGRLMQELASTSAPRVFAIVQEYGDRVDARCAAWGMAFEDRADVIAADGGRIHCAASPEAVLRRYRIGSHITPHLVWVTPAPEA